MAHQGHFKIHDICQTVKVTMSSLRARNQTHITPASINKSDQTQTNTCKTLVGKLLEKIQFRRSRCGCRILNEAGLSWWRILR
jgi:hypothetical protein